MQAFSVFSSIGLKLWIRPCRAYLPLINSIVCLWILVFSTSFITRSKEKTSVYFAHFEGILIGALSYRKVVSKSGREG